MVERTSPEMRARACCSVIAPESSGEVGKAPVPLPESRGGLSVVFDFDKTLVDGDTDTRCIEGLLSPDECAGRAAWAEKRADEVGWTDTVEELHAWLLKEHNLTSDDVLNAVTVTPMHPDVIKALRALKAAGTSLAILSDANCLFISSVLAKHGVSFPGDLLAYAKSQGAPVSGISTSEDPVFSKVVTNPAFAAPESAAPRVWTSPIEIEGKDDELPEADADASDEEGWASAPASEASASEASAPASDEEGWLSPGSSLAVGESAQPLPVSLSPRRVHIRPHDAATHSCPLCPKNLCKGRALHAMVAEGIVAGGRVVYVGDGANDFCPAMTLRSGDVVLARWGYPLARKLSSAKPAAKVRCWKDGAELARLLLEEHEQS